MMRLFEEIKTISFVCVKKKIDKNIIIKLLFHIVPFLAVKEEFHPKRNQARQKLATLPVARFQDLASDVYYELTRRYTTSIQNEVKTISTRYVFVLIVIVGTSKFTSYSSNPSRFFL